MNTYLGWDTSDILFCLSQNLRYPSSLSVLPRSNQPFAVKTSFLIVRYSCCTFLTVKPPVTYTEYYRAEIETSQQCIVCGFNRHHRQTIHTIVTVSESLPTVHHGQGYYAASGCSHDVVKEGGDVSTVLPEDLLHLPQHLQLCQTPQASPTQTEDAGSVPPTLPRRLSELSHHPQSLRCCQLGRDAGEWKACHAQLSPSASFCPRGWLWFRCGHWTTTNISFVLHTRRRTSMSLSVWRRARLSCSRPGPSLSNGTYFPQK